MARLDVTGAAMANPLGIPLFTLTAIAVPLCSLAGLRGWAIGESFDRLHGRSVVTLLAGAALIVWVTRVAAILFA